jgi:hypothetical protein
MEKKYRALRIIGMMYKILGIIAGAMTLLTIIGICLFSVLGGAAMASLSNLLEDQAGVSVAGGSVGAIIGGLILMLSALIWGGAAAISLYGFGELVYLLIDLESNSRGIITLLQSQPRASK